MSEHDANRMMLETARLRIVEPTEEAQLMTFSQRQYRAREGRGLWIAGMVADTVEAQIRSLCTVETASGAALDALCRIPLRPYGMTDEELRAKFHGRLPDFRDGRREYRLTAHEIAQQDGFPTDDVQ